MCPKNLESAPADVGCVYKVLINPDKVLIRLNKILIRIHKICIRDHKKI